MMSNVIVSLGGVAFQDMEIPEKISFGGRQRVAVQNLLGGGRVVEALGTDDGLIAFSGIFSGSDAVSRAQALDTARAEGAVLPLNWDAFSYAVIIETFQAEYRKPNLIPFSIICVVVDDSSPLQAASAAAGALAANALAAAAGFSAQAGFSVAGLSATSFAGIAAAQNGLGIAIGGAGNALVSATAGIDGAADAASGASAVAQLAAASSQLAALTAMSGFIGQAASNSGNAAL